MSDWTLAEPLDAAQGPAVCFGDLQTLSSQLLLLLLLASFSFLFQLTLFTFKAYKRQKRELLVMGVAHKSSCSLHPFHLYYRGL